ncbi:hypothetical protein U6N15_12960 [Cutibacterium acnes]
MQETQVRSLGWKDPLEKVYPLQYSVLENSIDNSPWGQKESDTTEQLSLSEPSMGFPESSVGKESASNAGDPSSIPGSGRSAGEGIGYLLKCSWASLVAQMVKNPPAMQETWVQSLGQEDPLEKGMATHFSILAWRTPWTEEAGGPQSTESQRVGND